MTDTVALVILAIIIFDIIVGIVGGWCMSKSVEGRAIHDKLEVYNTIAKTASTVANKQEFLTNRQRKEYALNYAIKALRQWGFRSIDVDLLSGIIEKAYQELFKTFELSYNVGLSTNKDGSEKDAFKDTDKDGVPDFLDTSTELAAYKTETKAGADNLDTKQASVSKKPETKLAAYKTETKAGADNLDTKNNSDTKTSNTTSKVEEYIDDLTQKATNPSPEKTQQTPESAGSK